MTRPVHRRQWLFRLAAMSAASLPAMAQPILGRTTMPPLRVILPVGAGSGLDTVVRTAQTAFSQALGGQAVVLENLPGAGGIIGTHALVRSPPDGSTVAFITNNHVVNPSLYAQLPYDGLEDITPIDVIGISSFVLVVNPSRMPVKDVRDMQRLLQAHPGKFNLASAGQGTFVHIAGEMVVHALNATAQHVPYKSMGAALTDLMAGQVDFCAASLAAVQGLLASGRLHAIGVLGHKRASGLPDLPTMAEQGFPEVQAAGWFGLIGPKGLPQAQVQRLHAAAMTAFNDPQVKETLERQDITLDGVGPLEMAGFLRSEQRRYARLTASMGLTPG